MSAATTDAWTTAQLAEVARVDEVGVASRRADGTFSTFATIWGVVVDNAVYVRSAAGLDRRWFVRANRSGRGVLRAGCIEAEVTFASPEHGDAQIDDAYHAKYDRYGQGVVGRVTGRIAESATLRMLPA